MESVTIRSLLDAADCRACVDLQRAVWNMPDVEVIPVPIMRAAIESGGLMQGAFVGDQLAGFTLAFAGLPGGEPCLYSHALGVHPAYRRLHLGIRLKWAQAQAVLARGITRIAWTYDPLQVPNAHLNLTRLGASSRTYLPEYYGPLADALNHSLPTDRLLVDWYLDRPGVQAVLQRLGPGAEPPGPLPDAGDPPPDPATALDLDQVPADALAAALTAAARGSWARCRIPGGVASLKAGDLEAARRWRLRLRLLLGTALGQGWTACAFLPGADGGHYWLRKESGGQALAN